MSAVVVKRTLAEWTRRVTRIGWDDTSAVQRAIDKAGEAGRVHIPAGKWRVIGDLRRAP